MKSMSKQDASDGFMQHKWQWNQLNKMDIHYNKELWCLPPKGSGKHHCVTQPLQAMNSNMTQYEGVQDHKESKK